MIDWTSREWISYIDAKVWDNLPESSLKTRNNSEINFRCPICGDSAKNRLKKRGYFYRRTGTYHCFNCGAHMTGYGFLKAICPRDVFDRIIQEFKVINFNTIVKGGSSIQTELASPLQDFEILSPIPSYKYLLENGWKTKPLTTSATKALDERKIPIGSRDMMLSMVDSTNREFVLIQYIWDDSTIYHQLWNFNKHDIKGQGAVKYVFPKDENINFQPKPVFNLANVDVSFPWIFCTEGVFDSLFLKNGVALGGKNLTEYQSKMLRSCYPRHKVVLALDNDLAGIQSSLKHAEKFPDLMFLDVSDLLDVAHVKDLNDFVKVTGRSDIFTNGEFLKSRAISAFQVEMKLKLQR